MSRTLETWSPKQKTSFLGTVKDFVKVLRYGEPEAISVQNSITFQKIYYDGICQVTDNYYTKIMEFSDINYILLDPPEKSDLRTLYKKLLDYFDPKIHMQLFLFNRLGESNDWKSAVELKPQGDKLDALREELKEFFSEQAKKGTNGIRKSKYILFGIECNSVREARTRLYTIEKSIARIFDNIGARTNPVDGAGWLELLYEYFNQGSQVPFRFSWEDVAVSGNSVKEYIAPDSFDFRKSNYFKSGEMYGSSFYLSMIAPQFTDDIVKEILDVDGNVTVSMHMQTVDPMEARKILKNKLTDVQGNKINNQRKAVQDGYDMDILPPDLMANEEGILRWLEGTNTRNRKMINVTFLISCFGRTLQELKLLQQRLSGVIQTMDMSLRVLSYQQEQGLMSCAPIGCNQISVSRPLDTISFSCLMPFCTHELFQTEEGHYCGLNALSNNLVFANRKALRNGNGVVLGTPGSGKSLWEKLEIIYTTLLSKDHILVSDPQGEYKPVVEYLGGQIIRLSLDSRDYINPLDIQGIHRDDQSALNIKSDFIITFVDAIYGDDHQLEADEKGILDNCIQKIYRKYFEDPRPENVPILEDLYEELMIHPHTKAESIADALYIYVYGSQNYFNHRTNVDSSNRLLCFDYSGMTKNLHDIAMLVVQDAVWNRVSLNYERHLYTRYACDEFHVLLRNEKTAGYMVDIWKKFRKWGGIPTAMTQNVADFLRSDDIEGILSNSDYMVLLNQSPKDRDILIDKLALSNEQLNYITNAEPGCGLLIYDEIIIPIINRIPTDTIIYKLVSTKPTDKFVDSVDERAMNWAVG